MLSTTTSASAANHPEARSRRTAEIDRDGRRVVVDDEPELAAVRRMVHLRADGSSLRAIARVLRDEGHATKRGGRWVAATVGRVLARATP